MIKENLPEELKIKRFRNPINKRWDYSLFGRKRGQKTWGMYIKEQGKTFLTEYLKSDGIKIEDIPSESYVWAKRKSKGFGWVKQR